MIRSMTGFGRASFEVDGATFTVELRSVNHRYLDLQVRLPRPFSALEGEIRPRLQQRFARGKIDVSVGTPGGAAPPPQLEIDLAAAEQYVAAARELRRSYDIDDALDAARLLALPGVARFVEARLPEQALRDALVAALEQAALELEQMRAVEGEALERELTQRLGRVSQLSETLDERAAEVATTVRERLTKRMEQLAREVGLSDPARLHQEVALAADRIDVTEELVRLRSHVEQFRTVLGRSGAVGRRLDFLLQEMAREANTVGSKGSDAPIAHLVVELKTELERLREQVQNVE